MAALPGSERRRAPRRWQPLLAAILVAGCQVNHPPATLPSAPAGEAEIKIQLTSLPSTTDPALTGVSEGAVARAVFEPLLRANLDLSNTVPAAAERYEVSGDGLTYTFHIRRGARWSDSTPVRARDFVAGWSRILDPRVNSPWGDLLAARVRGAARFADLDPVKDAAAIPAFLAGLGLRAPDDATFIVELGQPAPDFPWLAAVPQLAPTRDRSTDGAPSPPSAPRPGTGPYQVHSAGPQEVVLTANRHYWGGSPRVSRIVLTKSRAEDEIGRFRSGSVQLAELSVPGGKLAAADAALSRKLFKLSRLEQVWIQFNVHEAPFDDPRVRRAVAKSIDRDALITEVLGGAGLASLGLLPAGLADHRPALAAQRFDPAEARQLLAAAGVAAATQPPLTLLVRDLAPDRQLAEFVAGQVHRNLGLAVNLEIKPSAEVSRRLASGRFQLQGPSGWVADYGDERNWMDLFLTEHFAQSSRYSSVVYDRLVGQGDQDLEPALRRQHYLQAQQLLAEDSPVAMLYQAQVWYLRQTSLTGLRPSTLDSWPGDAWAGQIRLARH